MVKRGEVRQPRGRPMSAAGTAGINREAPDALWHAHLPVTRAISPPSIVPVLISSPAALGSIVGIAVVPAGFARRARSAPPRCGR